MAKNKVNTTNEEEKKKKKKLFIIFGSILGAGAIATAIAVPCVLLGGNSKAQEVKVDVPEINGLVFSNQKAYIGKDYDTEISVNKTLTTSLLPDELKSVKSGNRTITDQEYTYDVADNHETAQFRIPGKYIEGDVTIDFELVSEAPNYFYFKNVGDIDAKVITQFVTDEAEPETVFPDLHYTNDPNKDLDQWTELPYGHFDGTYNAYINEFTLKPNESIYFCGNNPDGINKSKGANIFGFIGPGDESTTEKLAVGGNISSLVYWNDFESKNEIPCYWCYSYLFSAMYNLVTGENLILPTNVLQYECFLGAFSGCKNLEIGPYLGAMFTEEDSADYRPYTAMFNGCEKLREIKVNFGLNNKWPEANGENATKDWLENAATSATNPTFYWRGDSNPDSSILDFTRDDDHVPDNWTITHWE